MSQERLEQLTKAKDLALVTLHDNRREFDDLREILDKGVELPVASRIIDEIWGDCSYSLEIKTRLFAAFPRENGMVILHSSFNPYAAARMNDHFAPIADYVEEVVQDIEETVNKILEEFKGKNLSDEGVLEEYNRFRKEVLRYISFCSGAFYDIRMMVESEGVKEWTDIKFDPRDVENGDYLFLDCFRDRLKKVHQHEVLYRVQPQGDWGGCLAGSSWKNERLEATIKLTYLFRCYIDGYLPQ